MNLFNFDIDMLAKTVMHTADIFECSLIEAWTEHTHHSLTEYATFEEVRQYIETQGL